MGAGNTTGSLWHSKTSDGLLLPKGTARDWGGGDEQRESSVLQGRRHCTTPRTAPCMGYWGVNSARADLLATACQSELIAPPVPQHPSLFPKGSGVQLHLQQQNLLRCQEPQQGEQAELYKPSVGKAISSGAREGSWPARHPLLFILGKGLVQMQLIPPIDQKSRIC